MAEPRACAWCRSRIEVTARAAQVFCSQGCRQFAFRLRRRRTTDAVSAQPMRFCYADPPYPGLAKRYYQHEDTYAGEVDHAELIASLEASGYDGWALSTSARALRAVLPLCPDGARVCPWVKPIGAAPATYGPHNTWEPLIVVRGRKLRPGFRDWLSAAPARGGGSLPGRKPIAFCAFLFEQLGMLPGDELVDLFPGTGVVGRAWAELGRLPSLGARADASPRYPADASQEYLSDAGGGHG
jgi:hypothetical protein